MSYRDITKRRETQRKNYMRNTEYHKKRHQKKRKKHKEWYQDIMRDKSCLYCGENCIVCLDWHHLDPSQKDKGISVIVNSCRSFANILAEMKKCIVICSNCHRKLHAGLIAAPDTGIEPVPLDLEANVLP